MLHTHIQPHTHKKNTPFGLYLYFSHVLFWHLMQGIWNATPVWLHEIQTAFCINTHAKLVKLHHSVWWNCPRESKRKLSTTEHIPVPKTTVGLRTSDHQLETHHPAEATPNQGGWPLPHPKSPPHHQTCACVGHATPIVWSCARNKSTASGLHSSKASKKKGKEAPSD